jgi:indolepyruvate ferredoxin oxidoreductase, beta subunit
LMAKSTAIEKDVWLEAMREVIPAKLLDVNLKAFEAGYSS